MRARLIVFPIKGRNWCFSRSIDRFAPDPSSSSSSSRVPSTFTDLWTQISSNSKPLNANAGLLVDFVSNKMNGAWAGLEKAPEGTMKNKLYGLGLKLLARVKPSEIFLKSITNEVNSVDITYPTSLNARLVRRRLRHIALRGTIIHKKYFYGSVTLLPLTTVLTVLPLPNIPFFWILFRTYSHWRALKGSEKLLQLVSDGSQTEDPAAVNVTGNKAVHDHSRSLLKTWVLSPSKELEELLNQRYNHDGLKNCAVADISKAFDLQQVDVLKYRNLTEF